MSTTVTVYLPDRGDRIKVRRAAKLTGKAPTAFMRDAVLEESDRVLAEAAKSAGICSGCGRPHKQGRAA